MQPVDTSGTRWSKFSKPNFVMTKSTVRLQLCLSDNDNFDAFPRLSGEQIRQIDFGPDDHTNYVSMR